MMFLLIVIGLIGRAAFLLKSMVNTVSAKSTVDLLVTSIIWIISHKDNFDLSLGYNTNNTVLSLTLFLGVNSVVFISFIL